MSNPLIDYYKQYYTQREPYTMEAMGDNSRVLQLLDWVDEHVPPGGKVLDVGCGDMFLSTKLPDREWTGVDINIDRAKGKAVVQDLMQTPYPFEAGSFDGVVLSEVAEHVWDMRVIHKEVARLLKRGGVYLVTTPNFAHLDHYLTHFQQLLWQPEQHPHTAEHIRFYNFVTHEKHLKEAGFEIIDTSGMDTQYSFFAQDARRYLKWLFAEKLKLQDLSSDGRVDQVIGRMFPFTSHTIGLVGRKL